MLSRETLLGRYSIEKKIGEGGFGIVYLAKDTRIERKVAIKTIASDTDSSEFDDSLRLFLREIQAIAKLDHPHILPLYDFGETAIEEANYTYMVMPYREEGTLGNWLKQRKDNKVHFPSLEDVAYILDQAADALQQAHNHNILHLDVKPSNFLIRNNKENPNRPYLLLADFGIAKFVNTSAELTKVRRGTPYYMPPEQWDKNRVPEPASDQYALAVTIYQLLTYKQVFEGDNELQVQFQHLNDSPTPPSILNPLISPEIDIVILTALAKDPKKRYPTITAFADAFKQALVNNASTRVILSISKTEAETGSSYPLKLSDGRQITVAVPAGVQDGDEIRQEGLGVPAYEGGPSPALIATIVVKPVSESERKIAAQLQSLEQGLQALQAKPSTDPNVVQQIQQLSKEVAVLQKHAANGDQSIVTQLQKLAKDVAAEVNKIQIFLAFLNSEGWIIYAAQHVLMPEVVKLFNNPKYQPFYLDTLKDLMRFASTQPVALRYFQKLVQYGYENKISLLMMLLDVRTASKEDILTPELFDDFLRATHMKDKEKIELLEQYGSLLLAVHYQKLTPAFVDIITVYIDNLSVDNLLDKSAQGTLRILDLLGKQLDKLPPKVARDINAWLCVSYGIVRDPFVPLPLQVNFLSAMSQYIVHFKLQNDKKYRENLFFVIINSVQVVEELDLILKAFFEPLQKGAPKELLYDLSAFIGERYNSNLPPKLLLLYLAKALEYSVAMKAPEDKKEFLVPLLRVLLKNVNSYTFDKLSGTVATWPKAIQKDWQAYAVMPSKGFK